MNSDLAYVLDGPLEPGELRALLLSAGMNAAPEDKLRGMLAGSSAYVTVREGASLVGFGRLLSDGHCIGYLNFMAVDPGHQSRGIGARILDLLVQAAGNLPSLYLYTDTADAFYLRHGFTRSEKRLYVRRAL